MGLENDNHGRLFGILQVVLCAAMALCVAAIIGVHACRGDITGTGWLAAGGFALFSGALLRGSVRELGNKD